MQPLATRNVWRTNEAPSSGMFVVARSAGAPGWYWPVFLVALVTVTVVHEFGHAFFGRLMGGRVRAVTIGRHGPAWTATVRGVLVTLHAIPYGGLTMAEVTSRPQ